MRSEERMVYIAEDGREFDSWDECNCYEQKGNLIDMIEIDLSSFGISSVDMADWIIKHRNEIIRMLT